MSDWQPIETAPYETPILTFIPSQEFGDAFEVLKRIKDRDGKDLWEWGSEYYFQPTHWMPLPEPPQVQ